MIGIVPSISKDSKEESKEERIGDFKKSAVQNFFKKTLELEK